MSETAIVFGASGTIGEAIVERLQRECSVCAATRSQATNEGWISTGTASWPNQLAGREIKRFVWSQGANAAGGIDDSSLHELEELFDANVKYIVTTLSEMRNSGLVTSGSRLCIVSSVWQSVARESKLAYVTTKSAVGGLVRSLAADLGPLGIRVNAVLPGVVLSPMTRNFLEQSAIDRISGETPVRRLVTTLEVAETVAWLTSEKSDGIHGQSIVVDNGWSVVRHV